jgi:hypothetical protein
MIWLDIGGSPEAARQVAVCNIFAAAQDEDTGGRIFRHGPV